MMILPSISIGPHFFKRSVGICANEDLPGTPQLPDFTKPMLYAVDVQTLWCQLQASELTLDAVVAFGMLKHQPWPAKEISSKGKDVAIAGITIGIKNNNEPGRNDSKPIIMN